MKKLLLTIITVVIFAFNSAFAFVPFVVPVITVAAASLLAVAGGVYYTSLPSSSSSHIVDSVANISRSSSCLYIALTSAPVPEIQSSPVHAQLPFSDIQKIIAAHPSDYPLTRFALEMPGQLLPSQIPPGADGSQYVGTVFADTVGGTLVKAYQYVSHNVMSNPGLVPSSYSQYYPANHYFHIYLSYYSKINGVDGYTTEHWVFLSNPASPPPPRAATPTEAARHFAGLPDGAVVPTSSNILPSFQTEIDKMLQDPEYVPSFTDDTTGLPYAPPAGLPSAAEVTAAVARANASGTATAAAESAGTAAQQAAAAAATAAAAAAAHPDDPALQNAAATAAANAATAAAAADALAAQQAAAAAAVAEADEALTAPDDPNAYGDGSAFDFGARMRRFIAEMNATTIFSLPSQVLANVPGGGTSVMNVSFGRLGPTSFDFADFSGSLSVLRALVLIIFSYCGFRIVTLKGGGG